MNEEYNYEEEPDKNKEKEDFLKEIRNNATLGHLVKFTETKNYIITGVRFYSENSENEFKDDLLNEIEN